MLNTTQTPLIWAAAFSGPGVVGFGPSGPGCGTGWPKTDDPRTPQKYRKYKTCKHSTAQLLEIPTWSKKSDTEAVQTSQIADLRLVKRPGVSQ